MSLAAADPCLVQSAEHLLVRIRALERRLDELRGRALQLEDALRWQAPSAQAYRARADEMRAILARGCGYADAAARAARIHHARLLAEGVP